MLLKILNINKESLFLNMIVYEGVAYIKIIF